MVVTAVLVTACSDVVGETPTETLSESANSSPEPTEARSCLLVTAGTGPVDTGSPSTDALFLSGEHFVCSDDVVVVGEDDLNEVAVAAQLAAALEGPLLFPDPRLAAEIGRLKPERVHVIGQVDVLIPPDAEQRSLTVVDAVQAVAGLLDSTDQVILPASPDASTIVETVKAIAASDRVAAPFEGGSTTSQATATIDVADVVIGLAAQPPRGPVWAVDAADPVTAMLAAAAGRYVEATVLALDGSDLLGYPEVAEVLATDGEGQSVRFVGGVPESAEWELAVLVKGQQVPGGGFHVLPQEEKRRYVAFYGHPETTALGALGEQGPLDTLERMQPFLEAYSADSSQTIPTFEMIASVASAGPTDDGDYSFEWPISTFEAWIETARDNDAYVILDLQPGREDFLSQAMFYEELLLLPFVGLALDPEWRLAPDQVHLEQVGRVDASEVNQVIHWLADLVRDNGLPQKMLIVHQFRTSMIQNRELLEQREELQLIIQMDGDGLEAQKDNTYETLLEGAEGAFWRWGWKNFFDEDEPGPPTPESTMGKEPSPVYVSYQ